MRFTLAATLTKPQKWIHFQKASLKNLFPLNVIYHAMPLAFIFVNGYPLFQSRKCDLNKER